MTDPTPLQEQVAEALLYRDTLHPAIASDLAAAVLPIIAAEVRKAQGEAWTDCVSEASALGWLHAPAALDMLDRNPHETED